MRRQSNSTCQSFWGDAGETLSRPSDSNQDVCRQERSPSVSIQGNKGIVHVDNILTLHWFEDCKRAMSVATGSLRYREVGGDILRGRWMRIVQFISPFLTQRQIENVDFTIQMKQGGPELKGRLVLNVLLCLSQI